MCIAVRGASSAQTTFGADLGRPTTVTLPRAYNQNRARPYAVAFCLHPLGGNGVDVAGRFFGGSSVSRAANSGDGTIIVTPSGTLNGSALPFWDASDPCCRLGFGVPVNDQGYLSTIAERIIASLHVDRSRFGAFGYSNGAFMASTLGACRPDLFTHVFALAGMRSLGTDAHMQNASPFFCIPTGSPQVHYTGIHGTADPTVLFDGDPTGTNITDVPNGIYLSAQASAEAWGTANGCTGAFASYTTTNFTTGGAVATLFRYPNQAVNGNVEFASLAGVGHNPATNEPFFQYIHDRFHRMPRV